MNDHAHVNLWPLAYGLGRCDCGAVLGVDGRWRTVTSDGYRDIQIGRPDGPCPHPFLGRSHGRLVCASCGSDHGPIPPVTPIR